MRLAQRSRAAAVATSTCVRRCAALAPHTPVPRTTVLARWTGADAAVKATTSAAAPQGIVGKGMSFAASLLRDAAPSTRSASTNTSADATVGDVPWDLCERMDYYVQYNIPSTWQVAEVLRDNSVAIQCCPPPPQAQDGSVSAGTVHGISLSCFAYKQRVKQPDSTRLLHVFLKRFNASVNNSLELLAEGQPPSPPAEAKLPPSVSGSDPSGPAAAAPSAAPVDANAAGAHTCQTLARQLHSAVAEISFTPAPGQPLARGLCRAFFNSNGRFHYVMVVAVPEDEYANSLDLIIHAIASVVESRVEAAAKRT